MTDEDDRAADAFALSFLARFPDAHRPTTIRAILEAYQAACEFKAKQIERARCEGLMQVLRFIAEEKIDHGWGVYTPTSGAKKAKAAIAEYEAGGRKLD